MIRSSTQRKIVAIFMAVGLPLVIAPPAFAVSGDAAQVENFIRSVIQLIAGLAGLVATGFLWPEGLRISPVRVIRCS